MTKRRDSKKRINPFKLYYYRKTAGLSLTQLAEQTSISVSDLKRLEDGIAKSQATPKRVSDFAVVSDADLRSLEKALNCKGILRAGKKDDFSTQLLHYYEVYKHQDLPGENIPTAIPPIISPKAIVFDFDGTLAKSGANQTMWESLWTQLGYEINECGKLFQRFIRKEIDHEEWCRLTLDKFRAKGLTRDQVLEVGRKVSLIKGFETTIKRIHREEIPMYIVSGSIREILISAIGDFWTYFARIEANVFAYTADDVIEKIVGTRYDFEGKADFVKMIAKNLAIETSQVLFVGNSINDKDVKRLSGARTLLINPHYADPNPEEWDYFIPHVENLIQILPFTGIDDTPAEPKIEDVRENDHVLAFIKSEDEIDLRNYTVVGGYRRFNSEVRARLLALSQQITKSLIKKTRGRQTYLISAAPGSGKTYFIEETARSMADKITFVAIDLNKDAKSDVESKLASVKNCATPCLCMIDEIDGKLEEKWPFALIYKNLDLNDDSRPATVVFTLIGSRGGGSVNALRQLITPGPKGQDMLDRIPENQKYAIEIPPLESGDGICVYVSKVVEAAAKENIKIDLIERQAVFYAAMMVGLKTPRQITTLADHAVARVKNDGTVLRYDHHFDSGDPERRRFWDLYRDSLQSLKGDLRIV